MSATECVLGCAAALAHAVFLYRGHAAIASGGDDLSTLDGTPPVVLPLLYLITVYGGNALMAGRKPYNPKASMAIYNLYATLLSGVMFFLLGRELLAGGASALLTTKLQRGGGAHARMMAAVWVNYQSKYIEYLDTLFMVLRAKREQITPLHVIHHSEMGPLMWLFCRIHPFGNSAFGPAINSAIHFSMYSYYGLTGVGISLPTAWKKAMTSAQLLQFVVILVHSVYHLAHWDTYWSGTLAAIQFALMLQMLYMFSNFFLAKYGGAKKAAPKKQA